VGKKKSKTGCIRAQMHPTQFYLSPHTPHPERKSHLAHRKVLRMDSREIRRNEKPGKIILSRSRKEREGLQKTKTNQTFFRQD
ncbi:TPA: hypothetical protein DDW35_03750, partial [Candidatus Sumerlaeota bacterium]|nr:hypothetical protein [Candidatus Sumerlaeota bacterium]